MVKVCLIAIMAVTSLWFVIDRIVDKLNSSLIKIIIALKEDVELLVKTINHIHRTLGLLRLKYVPEEEFKNISLELLDFLDAVTETEKFKTFNGKKL